MRILFPVTTKIMGLVQNLKLYLGNEVKGQLSVTLLLATYDPFQSQDYL